jgi:carbon starvation protein
MMSASVLITLALVLLVGAYFIYGRYLSRLFGVDPQRKTPAHEKQDGVDYVPTKLPVLMGHHFASIAGAAPIIGPVLAVVYGWGPVFIWVVLGSILLGGVHDFAALMASIRHGGKTIGEVIEDHVGRTGKRLFLAFAWCLVVLVIAAFADAVSNVFTSQPATATSSFLFIIVAVGFGFCMYRFKTRLWISSIVGVALLIGCIGLGLKYEMDMVKLLSPTAVEQAEGQDNTEADAAAADTRLADRAKLIWKLVLFVYIFFAAVMPVWVLLQPRDYLSSFLLYALLIAGVVGIFAANPKIEYAAFTSFRVEGKGMMFPMLFVMVACGAISGFHSLVSSGTTAKQLDKESHAQPVAYGSMLIEALLAVIALITAATVVQSNYGDLLASGGPINVFSSGIARFVSHMNVSAEVGKTFAALAISAFALTTLDTATRLGRFMFQEFFEGMGQNNILAKNRYIGTVITIAAAAILSLSKGKAAIWPLFGSANQLLASLSLLAITVWLTKQGKKSHIVKIPMIFMFAVALTAICLMVHTHVTAEEKAWPLIIVSVLLLAVALALIVNAWTSLRNRTQTAVVVSAPREETKETPPPQCGGC